MRPTSNSQKVKKKPGAINSPRFNAYLTQISKTCQLQESHPPARTCGQILQV
jgi:hypothetical protein